MEKRGGTTQIIFLFLMLAAISGLIIAVGTIYKYRDMLGNPIGYSMDKFGLEYCSCQNTNGEFVNINAIGNNQTEINLSNYIHCDSFSPYQINLNLSN